MAPESQEHRSQTRGSFDRFLHWLAEGAESKGERYLEMRRRLTRYFDHKGCLTPEDLADETLNRVARRLEEESEITGASPAQYCYIVARFVFLEYRRRPEFREVSLDDSAHSAAVETAPEEKRFPCLDRCLGALRPEHRELILEYYRGELRAKIGHRRALAQRFGLSANALSIRACRIREALEDCVRRCCAEE